MDKEQMIQQATETLKKMYYEDVEFFWNFVTGYAKKKGIV